MAKNYYQTTKVVKVKTPDKVTVNGQFNNSKVVNVESPTKVTVRAPGVAGPAGPAGSMIRSGPGLPSNLIGNVGDMWLNTTTSIIYGPKLITGWPTNPLFEGLNKDLLGQVYEIPSPASVWEIQHDLGYNPNATCIDTAGTVVEGDTSYPNENLMVISFIGAVAGKAYLS